MTTAELLHRKVIDALQRLTKEGTPKERRESRARLDEALAYGRKMGWNA